MPSRPHRQARLVAVRLLEELSHPGRRLDSLSSQPEFAELSSRDKRLVMELAYGTERWRGRLDYQIQQLSRRPLEKLDRPVLWILRTALYQMDFLRIPHRAAVHQAVEACRQLGKSSAAGFVNALLRQWLRAAPELPQDDSAQSLSIRFSHPQWLVRRYRKRWGSELARRLLEKNNMPPEGYLWVNPRKASADWLRRQLEAEGIACQAYPRLPNCLVAPSSLARHPLYRQGYCFFMDAASQKVAWLAAIEGRRRLGDFCSAPGGKAFVLAARMDQGALLHCTDSVPARLLGVRSRARLCRLQGLSYSVADWARRPIFRAAFDFVLADVPCSGLGTLSSNPDIRWKFEEDGFKRMQERQIRILENAFTALRPGGELLYSTCSTEPEENEQAVEEFLSRQPSARRCAEDFRSFPLRHDGEGFYAARIRHI
ncbi:MAG: transcription antitermination factor NusB [Acidobacteriota bacterium]